MCMHQASLDAIDNACFDNIRFTMRVDTFDRTHIPNSTLFTESITDLTSSLTCCSCVNDSVATVNHIYPTCSWVWIILMIVTYNTILLLLFLVLTLEISIMRHDNICNASKIQNGYFRRVNIFIVCLQCFWRYIGLSKAWHRPSP